MTRYLKDSRFIETQHWLALGIEPQDALQGRRVAHKIDLRLETDPLLPVISTSEARLERHSSCRFVLRYQPGLLRALKAARPALTLRIADDSLFLTPRRLRIPLPQGEPGDGQAPELRIRRPALLPGAKYPYSTTATGLRGVVRKKNGEPVRWARIVVSRSTDSLLIGRAQSDHRGEFLLLLAPPARDGAALQGEITASLTVHYVLPAVPPAGQQREPLWDLPLEVLPPPGVTDHVSSTVEIAAGYQSLPPRDVRFAIGRVRTDEPPFEVS